MYDEILIKKFTIAVNIHNFANIFGVLRIHN